MVTDTRSIVWQHSQTYSQPFCEFRILNNEIWWTNINSTNLIYGKLSLNGVFAFRTNIAATFTGGPYSLCNLGIMGQFVLIFSGVSGSNGELVVINSTTGNIFNVY